MTKAIPISKEIYRRISAPIVIFNQIFNPVYKSGQVIAYRSNLKGLRLTLGVGSRELTIQNSICKYFHGYNHKNFTYSEFQSAISSIESSLGLSLQDARIRSMEYGIVKQDNPERIFKAWGNYKNRTPQSMIYNGKIYGVYYQNSTHTVKCYDKTDEAKRNSIFMPEKLIRYEKRVYLNHLNSSSRFKNNPIHTLKDVLNQDNFKLLGEDLVSTLMKIELKNIPNEYNNLSLNEKRIWGYMQFEPIRNAIKKNHPESYSLDRSSYLKAQRGYRMYHQDQFIEDVTHIVQNCVAN